MRCPHCRHRASPSRWWNLPPTLTCYSCGVQLERCGRLSVNEAILAWLLVMLPGLLVAWLGGVGGFAIGGVLALLILPIRPWDGLRYQLTAEPEGQLPIAVARPKALGPKSPIASTDAGDRVPPAS